MVRYSTWLPSSCQTQRTNKVTKKYQIQSRHCGSSLSTLAGFFIGSVMRGSRFMIRSHLVGRDGRGQTGNENNPEGLAAHQSLKDLCFHSGCRLRFWQTQIFEPEKPSI